MARAYRAPDREPRARYEEEDRYRRGVGQQYRYDQERERFNMAKRSAGTGGWGPEEEERARMSVNRDLGQPYDYDPVTKRFQGDVSAEEERRRMPPGREAFRGGRWGEREMPERRGGYGEAERYGGPAWAQDRPVPSESAWMAERGRESGGQYGGRGPRGFRRSDDHIREEVCDRLTVSGAVDARDIQVEVHNAEVRLAGAVADRYQKRAAEDAAFSVRGVEDVQNELRIEERRGGEPEYRGRGEYQAQGERRQYEPGGQYQPGTQRPGEWARQLRTGMEVIDVHGEYVGRVKEISPTEFLVDRRFTRDVYIPCEAIRNVGDKVYIRMDEEQIENRRWAMTTW